MTETQADTTVSLLTYKRADTCSFSVMSSWCLCAWLMVICTAEVKKKKNGKWQRHIFSLFFFAPYDVLTNIHYKLIITLQWNLFMKPFIWPLQRAEVHAMLRHFCRKFFKFKKKNCFWPTICPIYWSSAKIILYKYILEETACLLFFADQRTLTKCASLRPFAEVSWKIHISFIF